MSREAPPRLIGHVALEDEATPRTVLQLGKNVGRLCERHRFPVVESGMRHAVITDCRQVDLIESMLLDASGEVNQSKRVFDSFSLITRLLSEDGSGVELD